MKKGKVYLIGAGPGDPGLITVRGARCLQVSDVIIYDHLVSEEILLYHTKDAVRLIYAGKEGEKHTLSQEEINQLLVKEAGRGQVVARLKGGDPFIFGRGGEEAQALARAGIPFEVIPGVTSAISVPAYAGIPLTHRGYTSSVAFVTGQQDPTRDETSDWETLSRIGTLVFLMGVKNLPHIVTNLIKHGKDAATPTALIRWGTTADQETLICPLGDMVEKAEERRFSPPAVLVVGHVVALREDLNWFEKRPLFGKGIVITRPPAQAHEFAALLREQGARVIPFPVIRIVPPEDLYSLDHAIEGLEKYQIGRAHV